MLGNGKILIFCVGLFLFLKSPAQINLVPNPSFENLSQCPTFPSQLGYAVPWFQPYTDTNGVQQSSTDLYSSCCSGFCGLTNNVKGSQLPRTGNSYIGISFYIGSAIYREYIEVKLNDSLINNEAYCVTFYASLADKDNYAASNFGVHFSEDSCLQIQITDSSIFHPAQAINPNSNIVTDKINWTPIELQYLAQGGENFITIGGFDPNNIIVIGGGTVNQAYYYIDDVSVIDISTPAYAGLDTSIALGGSIFIGRTPEIGLNDDCVWYVNGNPIDTVAGLWVMPDSTTTYILEQTICGYTTYDTVTVTVLPTNINELFKENNIRIYPNPNNGTFTIEYNLSHENYVLEIVDVMGKVVYQERFNTNNQQEIKLSTLNIGIYFVRIMNEFSIYSTKVNIIK
ncbi:MAG: T9SS type A sorting domain-containing protein [Flavobacteriales bacterium]|nr:T9SS type A sorting domain-containing protein [Flavobacteriales bacterium]